MIAELPGQGFQRAVLGRQLANGADGEKINVAQVIRHEAYNAEQNTNDIALLRLATPSKFKPVRLATKAEWPKLSTAGTDVTVIGWGATSEGGEQSNTLLQVTVPIISLTTCNQQYQGIIDERQVCAGLPNGGKDSCQGDSGGPLFEKVDGQNVQIGVVSFGNGCARAGFAGVYTAVASFRDWIQTNTKNAVPATGTTTTNTPAPDAGAPVPTPDAGAPTTTTTPDNGADEGASEETGSADPTPVGQPPRTTADEEDSSDVSDDEDDRPKKKKKSATVPAEEEAPPAQRVATCAMGYGHTDQSGFAVFLGLAIVGLAFGRRSKAT